MDTATRIELGDFADDRAVVVRCRADDELHRHPGGAAGPQGVAGPAGVLLLAPMQHQCPRLLERLERRRQVFLGGDTR